mmetsp:Transcript_10188/g.22654  ORF Transcript_10188/g.22654 Transcript_10188/m.22654 type:complete len:238 (-) Transcript_10188:1061-1774(-)
MDWVCGPNNIESIGGDPSSRRYVKNMTPGNRDSKNPNTTMVDSTENRTVNTEKGRVLPWPSDPNAFARMPAELDGACIDLLSPTLESIKRVMFDQAFMTPSFKSLRPFWDMLNMALTAFSLAPVLLGFCVDNMQLHTFVPLPSSFNPHPIPSNAFETCSANSFSVPYVLIKNVTSATPSTRCCRRINEPHAPKCASTSARPAAVSKTVSFIIPAICSSVALEGAKFREINLLSSTLA